MFYHKAFFPDIGSVPDSLQRVLDCLPAGWSVGFSPLSVSGYYVSPDGVIYDKSDNLLIPRSSDFDVIPLNG